MKTGPRGRKAVIEIPDRELPDAPPAATVDAPPEGWPRVSDDPRIQLQYEALRTQGQSHNFAELVSFGQFPGTKVEGGNDRFFRGRYNNRQLDEMLPAVRDRYLAKAKEAGVSVQNKVYLSTLAEEPGDPKAWVSDVSELKARCDQTGRSCEGVVNYTPNNFMQGEAPHEKRARRSAARKSKKLAKKLLA